MFFRVCLGLFLFTFGGCAVAQPPIGKTDPAAPMLAEVALAKSAIPLSARLAPRIPDEPMSEADCLLIDCKRRRSGELVAAPDRPRKDKPLHRAFAFLKEQVTWKPFPELTLRMADIEADGDPQFEAEYRWSKWTRIGVAATRKGAMAELEFRW